MKPITYKTILTKQLVKRMKLSLISLTAIFMVACKPDVPIMSSEVASRMLTAKEAIMIDVRENDEWQEQHIEGVIHIPLAQVKSKLAELSQYKNNNVIMQCRSGRRSEIAGQALISAGFTKVYNLSGGILAWDESGLATIRNTKKQL